MDTAPLGHDELRHLEVWHRSVRLENGNALRRRWRLARSGALGDPRASERAFPGQRDLLEFLAVAREDEVERMADCAVPLFAPGLPGADRPAPGRCAPAGDALDADSWQENFLALAARQDAVRTNVQQARVAFGLTRAQALWLSRFCPHELHALACDPSAVLAQAVHWEYFVAAAAGRLDTARRTLFGAACRRQPAASGR